MLAEETGDIFQKRAEGNWIIIPTNGTVKKDGTCVMGRGLALDIKNFYPEFPAMLGGAIESTGNQVYIWPEYGVVTFPVKHNWWEKADLELIEKSCGELKSIIHRFFDKSVPLHVTFYIPKVGCGNGKRDWETEVKPILMKHLSTLVDGVVVISEA